MVLLLSRQAVRKILHLPYGGLKHITRNKRQVDVVVEKSEKSKTKTIQQLLDAAPKKSSFPKHLIPFTRQQRRTSLASSTSPLVASPPRPYGSVQTIPIKPSKKRYEVAIVACGEFWSPQDRLKKVHGIKRVVVGYVGGQHPSPTFHDMKDHTQSLLVEYNPKKISYRDILQLWNDNDDPWKEQSISEDDFDCINGCDDTRGSSAPFTTSYSIFYPHLVSPCQHDLHRFQRQQKAHQSKTKCINSRSALFVLDQQQEEQAVEYVAELALSRPQDELDVDIVHVHPRSVVPSSVASKIIDNSDKKVSEDTLPPLRFYKAEEYQQDYLKKQREMAREQMELWKMDLCPSGLHPILE